MDKELHTSVFCLTTTKLVSALVSFCDIVLMQLNNLKQFYVKEYFRYDDAVLVNISSTKH